MGNEKTTVNEKYISTGSTLLDMVVGGAPGKFGFPFGKIVNIVGDKSSGKTFLALETIAAGVRKFKKNLKYRHDDCESGCSFDTQQLFGFSMPEDAPRSKTVEEAYCNIKEFCESLKADDFGIYVLDSLDGLTSDEMETRAEDRYKAHLKGKDFDKGSYQMGKAKYLSQEFFPQLAEVAETTNVLIIIISQVRQNIDSFSFEKYTRSGGKALDFYCHTILWLKSIYKIKKQDRAIGYVVGARTSKSKTPRPYRECEFSFLFDYGIDETGSNIDYLFSTRGDKGDLLKHAQTLVWAGKDTSLAGLKEFCETNGLMEKYTSIYGKTVKKSTLEEFLADERKTPAINELYEKEFGTAMDRETMVQWVESNNLEKELRDRVIEKWEGVEESIKSTRKPKGA